MTAEGCKYNLHNVRVYFEFFCTGPSYFTVSIIPGVLLFKGVNRNTFYKTASENPPYKSRQEVHMLSWNLIFRHQNVSVSYRTCIQITYCWKAVGIWLSRISSSIFRISVKCKVSHRSYVCFMSHLYPLKSIKCYKYLVNVKPCPNFTKKKIAWKWVNCRKWTLCLETIIYYQNATQFT